jgi:hypothetical protein
MNVVMIPVCWPNNSEPETACLDLAEQLDESRPHREAREINNVFLRAIETSLMDRIRPNGEALDID